MFQKSLLALAATATFCAPALAADFEVGKDTKFSINVDVGAYYYDIEGDKSDVSGSGVNQVEFKGSHQVSKDLSVFGEIEFEYDPVSNSGQTVKTDDVKLGLKHKRNGTFTIGQFDSYAEDNVFETLGIHYGDRGGLSEATSGNDGRHLQYLNSVGDLTFAVDLTYANNAFGTTASTDSDVGFTLAGIYKSGNLTVGLAHASPAAYKDKDEATLEKKTQSVKNNNALSLAYKMGDAKLLALASSGKKTDGTKLSQQGLGLTYQIGDLELAAGVQRVKTGTTKANESYVGASYEMFKNFNVYLDVTKYGLANGADDTIEIGFNYAF